ncbi:MAG: CPBP family intramembrane metalloprotease [Salinivirgaceae bacterium]|nr:CPBP family intramembrane metalloprotease [Salinivirgaceae bacterium]MDD4747033.1 CPBP family intramembrane metalloprotease [Salinivirgaceae bacterium]MDY0279558.1 CPBP family intramembrane glutamic endopeptidase [Salinivirgaceae bacterium]
MLNSQTLFLRVSLLFAITIASALFGSFLCMGLEQLFSHIGVATIQNPWYDYLRISTQTISTFGIPVLFWKLSYSNFSISIKPLKTNCNGALLGLALLAWLLSMLPVNGLWEINKNIPFHESLASLESALHHIQSANDAFLKYLLVNRGIMHTIALIIVVGALPAIFEELFFRGILQQLFIKASGKIWLSIFLASTIFSLFHMEFFALIPRILLGVILGVAYVVSQRLWLPILIHFVNNVVGVVAQLYLSENMLESFSAFGITKLEWILTLFLFAILNWLLVFMIQKFNPRESR